MDEWLALMERSWREQDHPRATDGKFGSGGPAPSTATRSSGASGTPRAAKGRSGGTSGTSKPRSSKPSTTKPSAAKSSTTRKAPAPAGPPPPAKDKRWLNRHYKNWSTSLTPAQSRALSGYQGDDYALMQGALRGKGKDDQQFDDADLARATRANRQLNDAIRKAPPLTEPMTVYRSLSAEQIATLTPGATMGDKGFVSTSLRPPRKGAKAATVEIALPTGTKAAVGAEGEMILPASGRFRVVSVEDNNGVPHVRMEFVPRASPKAKAAPADATPEAPKITAPKAPAKAPAKPRAAKRKTAPEATPATGMGAATRHETNTDGKQWLDQKMPSLGKKPFTAADRKALRDYTGPGYTNVNKALRNPGSPRDSNVQADIDALDAAMAKSVVPEDVIVHRGVGADYVQRLGGNVKDPASMRALIGKVSGEDAYLSTSAGQQSALAHKDIQLMMRVPKGTHGINVMPISASPNERELLLDRGTNWVVHDVYQDKGRWFLEVEAVPADFKTGTDWKPSPAGNAGAGYADLVPDNHDDYGPDYGDYGYED
ncbi:ADP-ribosyltransferase [Streptosporangium roseum]|uniref:ADP-ribosyltransferase n=1 Tax=Streptosporangium roseum TaxID=2001 RepID=UPI003318E503